jgi:hypothetical protein
MDIWWELTQNAGAKTVYVKLKDKTGNVIKTSDGITLQTGISKIDNIDIKSGAGTNTDSSTGQTDIMMARSNKKPIEFSIPVGFDADSVKIEINQIEYSLTESGPTDGIYTWSGTISNPPKGYVLVKISVGADTYYQVIGKIALIDPSGYIYNNANSEKVPGATVTLYWFNVATGQFEVAVSSKVAYDPAINPQISDEDGYYGWDVAPGRYYVKVERTWFDTVNQSRAVTVPPEVTDLHVYMNPQDTVAPSGTVTIEGGDSETDSDTVSLDIQATDDKSGVWKMALSNSSDFSSATWEDFAVSKSWDIGESGGEKKVYVKFKDICGNKGMTSSSINKAVPYANNLNKARTYPNPVKPGAGGDYDSSYITFSQLTPSAVIKIYDISGNQVAEIENTGNDGEEKWYMINDGGKDVVSGVYVWLIEDDDGNEKTGKLAIIR